MSTETPTPAAPAQEAPDPKAPSVQDIPEVLHKELVPIYTSYVTRLTEHYKIGLQQFQIYFGFNAGLFVLLGFVLKPFVEPQLTSVTTGATTTSFAFPPKILLVVLVATSLVGLVLTRHWRAVMRNSMQLQLHFNETLELWEKRLLKSADEGLYSRLNVLYPPSERPKDDLIDINVRVTWVFTWVWSLLGIASASGLCWPFI